MSEEGLLQRLFEQLPAPPPHLRVGVGDDCSVSDASPGLCRLCSTDLLVEDVHFRRRQIAPEVLGAKALAVNLSDIAAMGGWPREAFVSLALPDDLDDRDGYLSALYRGMATLADEHGVAIAGGDTTRSPGPLVINIAVIGEGAPEGLLLRSGARPRDHLFVSGPLGDAAAGLHASEGGDHDALSQELIRRHQAPSPRLALGRALARSGLAHAAMDLSDGLSTDLHRLLAASGASAIIDSALLPSSERLRRYADNHGLEVEAMVLHGGEDYELLVTGSAELGKALPGELTHIGEITLRGDTPLLLRSDGDLIELAPQGWDPFRV